MPFFILFLSLPRQYNNLPSALVKQSIVYSLPGRYSKINCESSFFLNFFNSSRDFIFCVPTEPCPISGFKNNG